jgi:hypothetical protein
MRTLLLICACMATMAVSAQQVSNAEYFWDVDPGVGGGIAITIDPADELLASTEISTTGLAKGLHKLVVRTRDEVGHWSHMQSLWVIIEEFIVYEVVAAEYWWDNDPGPGLATSVEIISGEEVTGNFGVSTDGLLAGKHVCGFRVQNAEGVWSLHEKVWVMIDDQTVHLLQQAEYFWDVDPGVGNGTPIFIDPNDNWIEEVLIENTGLDVGIHWIHIRTIDEDGNWSHYHREPITICTTWGAIADWTMEIVDGQFNFSNSSEYATSYSWLVDGIETSTDPDFSIVPEGPQEVCLVAVNECDSTTLCTIVGVPLLIAAIGRINWLRTRHAFVSSDQTRN